MTTKKKPKAPRVWLVEQRVYGRYQVRQLSRPHYTYAAAVETRNELRAMYGNVYRVTEYVPKKRGGR